MIFFYKNKNTNKKSGRLKMSTSKVLGLIEVAENIDISFTPIPNLYKYDKNGRTQLCLKNGKTIYECETVVSFMKSCDISKYTGNIW